MRTFLEWLKPGVKVKRYILLQLVSIATLAYSVITLTTRQILTPKILIAYIALITLSLFTTVYSFLLAQRSVLKITLKNMAYQEKNVEIRRLLYTESMLKKGPKVVIIGGGKGLSNVLSGLKEFTTNITTIVSTFDDENNGELAEEKDILPPGDIRRSIIALSPVEPEMEKLLGYKFDGQSIETHSIGNLMIAAMTDVMGGFQNAVPKLSKVFNIKGNILPITLDKAKLCAGLENGEIVVGQSNIRPRVIEAKSRIKQVFLKDTEAAPAPGVIEAITEADIIVLGPGSLYTSVICNLLVNDVSKAIVQSKAKKIMIANLMNEPGETLGYTLARHVNEVERYLGRHVIDYVLANSGEITEDMMYDLNQGSSTPVTSDLENIQNRTISVIEEDFVITAPNAILHDNLRVAEIIIEISKSKNVGTLNLLQEKNKKEKKSFTKKISRFVKNIINKRQEKNKQEV